MKLIRNVLAAGIFAGAAAIVACSGQTSPTGTAGTQGGNSPVGNNGNTTQGVGSVRTALTVVTPLLNGDQFQSFSYTISGGPGGTYGPTTETIGDAQSIEWVSGGILAGCGYTLSVTGSDSHGDPCSGTSASFCVTAGQTTAVGLNITCTIPTDAATSATIDTGSVAVDASVSVTAQGAFACPGISSFSASPAELLGQQPSLVSVATTGGTVVWSATACAAGDNLPGSGTIGGFFNTADGGSDTSDNSVNFNCGSCTGVTTVTAQVQLNVVPLGGTTAENVCNGVPFTTYTASIVCEGGGVQICTGSTPNSCSPSDGGAATCTNLQTDNNNCGTCGTVCSVSTGFTCQAGVCKTQPPSACQTSTEVSGACPATGPGSITCTPGGNTVCTPTEAAIVNLVDVPRNNLTAAGQLQPCNATAGVCATTSSCYACLVNNDCIDNSVNGDTNKECGDLGASTAATLSTSEALKGATTPTEACLNVLGCFVGSGCATANPPGACYCGTESGASCQTNAGNGPCLGQVIDGLGAITGDSCTATPSSAPTPAGSALCVDTAASATTVFNDFTAGATATAQAVTLSACAISNCAAQCGSL